MKKILGDELKVLQLLMMKELAKFCDKHNIRYYLSSGTMLGAVRHKGYIPWDDDIDLMMPRPDYNKLIELFNAENNRYKIRAIENDPTYWRAFAKVFDTYTYLDEPAFRYADDRNAIFIDIFPMDGIPENFFIRKKLYLEQTIAKVLYNGTALNMVKSNKYVDSKSKFSGLKGYIRTALKYIVVSFLHKLPTKPFIEYLNYNPSKYKFEESKYVGVMVEFSEGLERERIRRDIFEPRALYNFENLKLWGTKSYDHYLSNIYGDYMTPPPVSNQIAHHDFEVYWRDGYENHF